MEILAHTSFITFLVGVLELCPADVEIPADLRLLLRPAETHASELPSKLHWCGQLELGLAHDVSILQVCEPSLLHDMHEPLSWVVCAAPINPSIHPFTHTMNATSTTLSRGFQALPISVHHSQGFEKKVYWCGIDVLALSSPATIHNLAVLINLPKTPKSRLYFIEDILCRPILACTVLQGWSSSFKYPEIEFVPLSMHMILLEGKPTDCISKWGVIMHLTTIKAHDFAGRKTNPLHFKVSSDHTPHNNQGLLHPWGAS